MKKLYIVLIFILSFTTFSKGLENKESEDILQGRKIRFYKNGNIKAIENWEKGRLTGKFVIYLENGTKILESNYLNGKEHGTYLIFHDNGLPYIEGYFSYGIPKKMWSYYDEKGMLKTRHTPNS